MIFTSPIINSFINGVICCGDSGNDYRPTILANAPPVGGGPQTRAVTVFSGAQPSAASIAASWPTYNTLVLQHWPNVLFGNAPGSNTFGSGYYVQLNGAITPTTTYASGTATWGILWGSNVSEVTVLGSSLPNSIFMVVPVTDQAGTGTIKLLSTTLTSGASVAPTSIYISLGLA